MPRSEKIRSSKAASIGAASLACVVFAAFPFYWMLITAFKTDRDLYNLKDFPFWLQRAADARAPALLFEQTLFVRWLLNTLIIGLAWWRSRW